MRALAVVVAVLATAAPARATFSLYVDATSARGHLRILVLAEPGTRDLAITEGGRPIGGIFEPFHGGALTGTALGNGGVWKCSRRDRTFVATAVDAAGAPQRSAFTVRTPSCANRLTLRTAPRRATVVDSFGLGGVRARLCARTCRTVSIPLARRRQRSRCAVAGSCCGRVTSASCSASARARPAARSSSPRATR